VSIAKFAGLSTCSIVKGIDAKDGRIVRPQRPSHDLHSRRLIDVSPVLARGSCARPGTSRWLLQDTFGPNRRWSPTSTPPAASRRASAAAISAPVPHPDGSGLTKAACIVTANPDGSYGFDWEVGGSVYVGVGSLEGAADDRRLGGKHARRVQGPAGRQGAGRHLVRRRRHRETDEVISHAVHTLKLCFAFLAKQHPGMDPHTIHSLQNERYLAALLRGSFISLLSARMDYSFSPEYI